MQGAGFLYTAVPQSLSCGWCYVTSARLCSMSRYTVTSRYSYTSGLCRFLGLTQQLPVALPLRSGPAAVFVASRPETDRAAGAGCKQFETGSY